MGATAPSHFLANIKITGIENFGEGSVYSTLRPCLFSGCKATAELMYTGTTMLGCNSYREAQKNACDCGDVEGPPDDVLRVTSGKSTLKHARKSVNAEPIPGTENENAEKFYKTNDVPKSESLLKATKLKANKVHRHDDL